MIRIPELKEHLTNVTEVLNEAKGEILRLNTENTYLKKQVEKMKCCFSESDNLNGTFCHKDACFVIASSKCKLWVVSE